MKFLKSQLTTDLQLPLSPEFYSPANPSQELSNIINSIEKTEPIKLVLMKTIYPKKIKTH